MTSVINEELLPSEELIDSENLADETDFLSPDSTSLKASSLPVHTYKALMNEQTLKLLEEVRWRGRNQSFNYSLAAFISVCVSLISFYDQR